MRRLGIWVLALAFGSAADVGAQDDVDRGFAWRNGRP